MIFINVLHAKNFSDLNIRFRELNKTIDKIEENQNFNFIQGAHNKIEYQLTPNGVNIMTATDYGLFNGPSMQPSIFDGNTLIEELYDGRKLEEGQLVRFLRDDDTAVIHRVRADYGNTVSVQGDSLKEREIISKNQITHVVIGVLYT